MGRRRGCSGGDGGMTESLSTPTPIRRSLACKLLGETDGRDQLYGEADVAAVTKLQLEAGRRRNQPQAGAVG